MYNRISPAVQSFFILLVIFLNSIPAFTQKLNEDSLWQLIKTSKIDTVTIDAKYTLGNILIKDPKRDTTGKRLIDEAKQLSEKIDFSPGVAQGLLLTGNYYSRVGQLENCMDAYEQLIRFAGSMENSLKRKQFLRSAYNNLGGIYNRHGDFPTSLQNRLKALEIVESMESPSPDELFICYYNAASDFRQLKQFDKAREYLLKLRPLLSSIIPRYQLEYYYEFYQLLVPGNERDLGREILHKYDSSLQVLNLTETQRTDYTSLSKRLHGLYEQQQMKNPRQALYYFAEEVTLTRQLANPSSIISAEQNYASALFELGRYRELIEMLEGTYATAAKDDLKNQALKAAVLLSQAYERENDMKNGYRYAAIARELQDSIMQEDAVKRVAFLEAKYQHEQKEKEISELQLVNQAKEYVIRRKNWLIAGTIVIALMLGLLAFFSMRYYRNRQKLLKQEKVLHEEKISNLEKQQQVASLQAMINGQEMERTRIARDLHDGLGGIFSTVKMHYSTLNHETPQVINNPVYRKTMDLINNASDELRRVAHNMMPEVLLKVGLDEALKDLCSNISSGKLLKVTYQGYGMESRLSGATEIMLYRIIQELVNNIIKHAEATEAIIQINRQGNRLSLTIEDNGRGFDTNEAAKQRSLGMSTVRSRVDYLNGHLSIDSRKDMGTTVMIDILLNEN